MPETQPDAQREFAFDAVRRLRAAGFEAYWAGGCVRDQLMGRVPKDYDVATDAKPPEIRELFGRRKTLAIGAAFGVITVVGPRPAGQLEVATFREDATYSDGRHPDRVSFSSAAADAQRRDFTINGLFYDPVDERVIDYVGGQADLQRRVLRAIGVPDQRFAEDKLRMLRAVRFAAAFDFALDPATQAAIGRMAAEIRIVSPERIAMEMRRMLVEPGRVRAVQLLLDTNLAAAVLPEIVPQDDAQCAQLARALAALGRLERPGFPLGLASLVGERLSPEATETLGRRWKLTNKEIERAAWLVKHRNALRDCRRLPWSQLQPLLIDEGSDDLVALTAAAWPELADEVAFCREQLARPRAELDPPPLLTGDDLLARGLRPGPQFAVMLQRLRAAQLDGQIASRDAALAMVERLAAASNNSQL